MSSPPSLPLLLASTSPGRRAIFEQAGLYVEVAAPTCDEDAITARGPGALALARARAKAESLANDAMIVIGADQVCHLGHRIFRKPRDEADHLAQLRALRGRTHTLCNGVSVLAPGRREDWITRVRVRLRADLSDDELGDYVDSGDARGCAGGYRLEGPGARLVERVQGDSFAVVGLPLLEVLTVLRRLGWRPAPISHKPRLPLQGQHP